MAKTYRWEKGHSFKWENYASVIRGRKRGTQRKIKPGSAIHMPPPDVFTGSASSTPTEAYYSTLLHKLTHWTALPPRCDRDLSGRFGTEAYAMEELVAELGAAFLCAELGIAVEPRADHAQYLAHWLKVLKADKRAIFTAPRGRAKRPHTSADRCTGSCPQSPCVGATLSAGSTTDSLDSFCRFCSLLQVPESSLHCAIS
ncbi:hypothetical protein ABIA94_005348 [Bradyrhizobium sp. LA7.1]